MILPLIAPLLVLAQAAAPTLPLPVAEPMGAYLGCLMQPIEASTGIPPTVAQREAMYRGILDRCRDIRAASAAEAEQMLGYADPAGRAEAVNAFFSYWEQQIHFMIVENERFVAQSDAYEACLESGQPEAC